MMNMPAIPPEARRRGRIFGRRIGRKLRPQQRALIEDLLPKLSFAGPTGSLSDSLDPRAIFDKDFRAIWLEIGFGSGELLAHLAAANRDVGYIGADVFVNGIAGLLARLAAEPMSEAGNIRLFVDDALELVRALRSGSIERLLIPFPDPWPKARHHKRRLIGPDSAAEFARVLAPGGRLEVASDDPSYIEWIVEHLGRCPDLRPAAPAAASRPSDWIGTRYAAKALRAGRNPHYMLYYKGL